MNIFQKRIENLCVIIMRGWSRDRWMDYRRGKLVVVFSIGIEGCS